MFLIVTVTVAGRRFNLQSALLCLCVVKGAFSCVMPYGTNVLYAQGGILYGLPGYLCCDV